MVSPTAATFYFYKSFWSMLRRSQALETPQLGFRELNGRKSSWTWPSSAPKPPRPGTFSGTFSGTLLNVTWLCTKEPGWTWPGACTSAHRSYSGLKTPLAYAGEKQIRFWKVSSPQIWGVSINKTQYFQHFQDSTSIWKCSKPSVIIGEW